MQTPVDVFEKQIKTLKKIGYTPISYEDLVQYKEGKKKLPKRSYLITFDDGYIGIYNYAFQIAKKYNIFFKRVFTFFKSCGTMYT